MAEVNADRNLLFGILALQMDFIGRDALIAAMHAWVLDKAKPLGRILRRAAGPGRRRARPAGGAGRRAPGSSTAATPSRAWRPSARSAPVRERPGADRRPRPRRPRLARVAVGRHRDAGDDPEATADLRRRHADRRRLAVPHPAAARPGRPGRGLRGPRRGAEPRGGAEGDPGPSTPTTRPAAPGSCSRPRSPAGWSTRGSSRSTAWAPTPTAGRTTPCGSSGATASRRRSTASTPTRRPRPRPGRAVAGVAQAAAAVRRRLQRDRLRPQPGRAAPRPQAGQHHARPVRRDAGGRLGPGQGRRPRRGRRPASAEATLRPASASRQQPRRWPGSAIGHAGLHEPRAGRGAARPARPGQRRLQPGGDALLPADRASRRSRSATSARCCGRCSGASSRRRGRSTRRSPPALEAICLKAMALRARGPLRLAAGAGRGRRALAGRRAGRRPTASRWPCG